MREEEDKFEKTVKLEEGMFIEPGPAGQGAKPPEAKPEGPGKPEAGPPPEPPKKKE